MKHFDHSLIVAYNWGRLAALDGLKLLDNPYLPGSNKHDYWLGGFYSVALNEVKRKDDCNPKTNNEK